MKKIFISMTIIIVLIISIMTFTIAASSPTNTHDYTYYVKFYMDGYPQRHRVFYTENPGTFNEETNDFIAPAGGCHGWFSNDNGVNWSVLIDTTASFSSNMGGVIEANYSLGSYVHNDASIVSPINFETYLTPQDVIIEFLGGLTPANVTLRWRYIGAEIIDTIINCSKYEMNINNQITILKDDVTQGFGSNIITITDHLGIIIYDQITIYNDSMEYGKCYLTGVKNGSNYSYPPLITLEKFGYENPVSVYVNDTKYMTYTENTGSYYIQELYWHLCSLGENEIRLYDETDEEDIQVFVFNVLEGQIDSNGYYSNPDYHSDAPNSFVALKGHEPVKPGENATIIDWVIYIGEMIAYIFEIAMTAIVEFAKSVGDMLSSLFGMIQPILVFIQQMFASLPGPISAGLYALFTLSCVLVIFKVLRRG